MPLLETKGAASGQGFGLTLGSSYTPTYIEDVFGTTLYQGNSSTQTITNGIDLAGKGGLVWLKTRSVSQYHYLFDTSRGPLFSLSTNATDNSYSIGNTLTAFNSNGFNLGLNSATNGSSTTFASWTFRKQAKFFDVVTYTGNGSGPRAIPHNLGSTPGVAILKKTSTTSDWIVTDPGGAWGFYGAQPLYLNNTNAKEGFNQTGVFSADATSIYVGANTFSTGTNFGSNDSGVTYVAYLFAHNAGGFGPTGTDNVITCGSFVTSNTSGFVNVQLGWEPQWILFKKTTSGGANETINDDWFIADNMRGLTVSSSDVRGLHPNLSAAEGSQGWTPIRITATGFQANTSIDQQDTFVYIAIRRGPMRTPTTGTSVFYAEAVPQGNIVNSTGVPFPPDLVNTFSRNGTDRTTIWQLFSFVDRLRGLGVPSNTYSLSGPTLIASSTNAEDTGNGAYVQMMADGRNINRASGWNDPMYGSWIYYFMRRAPGFFDVVCYTGTSSVRTVSHNLGVAPELLITKSRGTSGNNWSVYSRFTSTTYGYQTLQTDSAGNSARTYGPGGSPNFEELSAAPTASVINLASSGESNFNGRTFVAYLFASCPGVSKVGTYTGTGNTLQINCGFTGGARFVLIKRTDSNGDWYVWDSARGIVAGNDPYLLLNSTAAEVTNTDWIDTHSAGFEISNTAPAAINANGGSFIFLAIA